MKFSKGFFLLTGLILLIAFLTSATFNYITREQQLKSEEQKRTELYDKILGGAKVEPAEFNFDFSNPIANGSPLVFGGAQNPKLQHTKAWDDMQEINMVSVRADFYLEQILPSNITLSDYKNNVNDVQNPENWNRNFIEQRAKIYKNAKDRNIKSFGILSYAPAWLTYSGTTTGVPKDWEVYEDIVKKVYSIYRDDIDYLEIWNEPTYDRFMNVTNSGLTKAEAYKKIYEHAYKAIQEVEQEKTDEKKVLIGAQIAHKPNDTTVLKEFLTIPNIKNKVDFISYHNYEINKEPSWTLFKNTLKNSQIEDIPIFITEWNYDPSEEESSPYKNTNLAITYTGNKLTDYLKLGVAGANYYSLHPYNTEINKIGEGTLGFYIWDNDEVELLPQAKTWRLMSNKMGLGKGKSQIFDIQNNPTNTNGLGFINSEQQRGVVIVNEQPTALMTTLNLKKIGIKNYARVIIYYASSDNYASTPVYDGPVKSNNGNIELTTYIPKEAILGIIVTEDKAWYDFLNLPY